MESVYELDGRGYAGYCHHRWFVEVIGNHVIFRPKTDLLHGSRRFHLPRKVAASLSSEEQVTWLFWDDNFTYEERFVMSRQDMERDLIEFRSRFVPANTLLVAAEDPRRAFSAAVRRRAALRRLASVALRREIPELPYDKWGVEPPRAL